MKRINAIFFAAVAAALSLVSCSQENLSPIEKPQGELVTVHFGAESGIVSSTKATLTTEDEATFRSAWTDGDVLSVEYNNDNDDNNAGFVDATWKVSSNSFETQLPSYTGIWMYDAVYPAPGSDGTVDFGFSRTQNGNNYNSIYDLMEGSAVADNAAEGKDDFGKDIIFEMNRQTAIAYFHLTSGLDEEVVSATLSVEGEAAVIATKSVKVSTYSKGFEFVKDATNGLKEITINFEEGTAPKASELKLWFNVLPTEYTSMKLEVESTGHKLTLINKKQGSYTAANLYKVVKTISTSQWVAKTAPITESLYVVEFNSNTKSVTTLNKDTKASTLTVSGSEYVTTSPFSSVTNVYYGGDSKSGLPLRVGKSDAAGSVTIALSDKGKVDATKIVLSAKQYSSGKTKMIGVNGSVKQQPGDDYTDLTFTLDGKSLQSIKLDTDGYI